MEELVYSIDWEQVKTAFDVFMWGDPTIPVRTGWVNVAVAAVGLGISATQAIMAKKRRKTAMEEYEKQKASFESQEITNPYANMQNPYEDITVNQQQAKFLGQQQQQALATTTRGLWGVAGSAGAAVLAQSMANQQMRQRQGISGMIGQQESANQRLVAGGQMNINMAEAQGETIRQQRELGRTGTLLGMSQQQVAGEQARLDAAIGGVAEGVGALGGAIEDKIESKKLTKQKGNMVKGITGGETTGKTGIYDQGEIVGGVGMTTKELTTLPDADFSQIGADFMGEEEEFMKGVPGYDEGNVFLPETPDDLGPGGGKKKKKGKSYYDPVTGKRIYPRSSGFGPLGGIG